MFKGIFKVIQRSLLALMIVLLVSPLQAQSGTGYIQSAGAYQTQWGGWYTSPYQARFTSVIAGPSIGYGLPVTNTLYNIFCVDFYHHDQSYSVNFSNLADEGSITTFTRTGNVAKYTMAAWLASQLDVSLTRTSNIRNGTINAAIWQVMSGTTTPNLGISQYLIDDWKIAAMNNYNMVDPSQWVVITSKNAARITEEASLGGQEFMTRVQVTPEPATMLLLGSGLMIMLLGAGVLRRSMA